MKIKEKIKKMCGELYGFSRMFIADIETPEFVESDYKVGHTPPADGWKPLTYVCGKEQHFWVRGKLQTPPAEEGFRYILTVNTGINGWDAVNPQGILYLNGEMVQGLDVNHHDTLLQPDTAYDLVYYFYTGEVSNPIKITTTIWKEDIEAKALYYDLITPFEALAVLNENTAEYCNTLSALEQAITILDVREPHSEAFRQSVSKARQFMKENFYDALCTTEGKPVVHCIGHTHIDVEWLWARRQTREKIQRSFSTAKELMDQYPEYLFTLSQPELYRYLKEEAPEKYAQLKELVAQGRWEPEGAVWVENDCNLVSGESFVRQIIHGKRFFKEEFGVDSRILFLPDVFGYSAALPQILKKANIDYFVTSKISWNDTNMMPYDSFMWQGIDGSEIYTTFITGQGATPNHGKQRFTTYVGTINASFAQGTWDRYQQKEYNKHTLLTYGYGDGGGGPTAEMLEKQRRLAKGLPGIPVTKTDFLLPFLKEAEASFKENCKKLQRTPKWVGELYLELHRGTYTSIAKNKRGNRKSELALQKTEALSFTDLLHGGTYDAEGLYYNWRRVLHNQFHDILPGSSIEEVYNGTDKDYAEIGAFCADTIQSKLAALAERVQTNGGIMVYNPLGFAAGGTLQIDGKTVEVDEKIPAFGWKVIKAPTAENAVSVNDLTAENMYYRLTLDQSGRIVSLYDKQADREVVLPGRLANEFQAFEDYPYDYDAWEIDDTHQLKMYVLDAPAVITPIVDGARSGFEVKHTYMQSTIVQKIWLYSKGRRIDFENEIDWHNKHQILKVAFPLDVHADRAAYDIQFGHVYRPTHKNTSWDAAKFEVCGHKWVDVSDNGYGVALLNDCKYGFGTEQSTLKLTVLKSATYPNLHADEGRHEFSYSLIPHSGTLYEADIIKEAHLFNQPLTAIEVAKQDGPLSDCYSLVSCDNKNVVLETVKKAEADDSMIVRMYESFNTRTKATVTVADGFNKAYLCDLLENELEELPICDNTVTFPIKNFEIITLKFKK